MDLSLRAVMREKTGKESAVKLRQNSRIPAVLYGEAKPNEDIAVGQSELEQILQKGGAGKVITLLLAKTGKDESQSVLLKDIQRDPVKGTLIHVDFWRIAMNHLVNVKVPLHFENEDQRPRDGAFLQISLHELDISCLPGKIPDKISVDVGQLALEKGLYVKDLALPEGLRPLNAPGELVVEVILPSVAEEKPAATEATSKEAGKS